MGPRGLHRDRLLPRHEIESGLKVAWDITNKRTRLFKKTEVSGRAVIRDLSLEGALVDVPDSYVHSIGSSVTVRIGAQEGQLEICRIADGPPGFVTYGTRFVADEELQSSVNQIVADVRSRTIPDHLTGLDRKITEPVASQSAQTHTETDARLRPHGAISVSALVFLVGLYAASLAGLVRFELFTPSLGAGSLAQISAFGIVAFVLGAAVSLSKVSARRGWRYLVFAVLVSYGATLDVVATVFDTRAVLVLSLAAVPLAIVGLASFERSSAGQRSWVAVILETVSIVAVISAPLWIWIEQIASEGYRWSSPDLALHMAVCVSYMLLAGVSATFALSSQKSNRSALSFFAAWAVVTAATNVFAMSAVVDGGAPAPSLRLVALAALLIPVAGAVMSSVTGQVRIGSDMPRADRGVVAILPVAFAGLALGGHQVGLFDETVAWIALLGLPAGVSWIVVMARESRETAELLVTELDRSHMRQDGLVYAKNDAESARRAQQIFLSRTSHELRTPIHILNGFSELLSLTNLDQAQRELIDHVRSAGDHLSELVADVLDLSQIDQGRLAIRLETVEVNGLVSEVVEQMGPDAEERSARLIWSPSQTEKISTTADPARLRQVLMNLLTNALKYAGGTIVVSTDIDDSEIAIHVTDEGPGVAASDLDRMFAPFERIGAALGEEPGAGLGLSVARSLCEAMGGALCVESDVGVGSRFTVSLPVDPSAAPDEGAPVESQGPNPEDDELDSFLPAQWLGVHT